MKNVSVTINNNYSLKIAILFALFSIIKYNINSYAKINKLFRKSKVYTVLF